MEKRKKILAIVSCIATNHDERVIMYTLTLIGSQNIYLMRSCKKAKKKSRRFYNNFS